MVNEEQLPKSGSEKSKIEAEILEGFIKSGLDLIKEGNYRDAVNHFNNKEIAERIGFLFSSGRTYIFGETPTPESVKSVLSQMDAWFIHEGYTTPKLIIPGVIGVKFSKSGEIENVELPPILWQNVVLLSAEEWLHGLQYIRGQPIAGYEDKEIDVAFYLRNQGITLTDNFLRAHGREREHPELRNISSQKE